MSLNNKTLTEETYDAIKERIFKNEFKPGDPLSIENLAEELGVSQTPIREALIRLSNDGLVEYNPRKKACVSEITTKNISETYEVRKILEPYVASNAAANPPLDELRELKEELEEIKELTGEEKYQKFYETDIELNDLLMDTVGNNLLLQLFDHIENYNIRIRFFASTTMKNSEEVVEEGNSDHLAIVNALLDKSPQRARHAVLDHLQKAERRTWHAVQQEKEREKEN